MRKMEFSHLGLTLEEKQGVKVIQNGKSYFARDWQLTDDVKEVIETSIHHRFDKLWVRRSPTWMGISSYLLFQKPFIALGLSYRRRGC